MKCPCAPNDVGARACLVVFVFFWRRIFDIYPGHTGRLPVMAGQQFCLFFLRSSDFGKMKINGAILLLLLFRDGRTQDSTARPVGDTATVWRRWWPFAVPKSTWSTPTDAPPSSTPSLWDTPIAHNFYSTAAPIPTTRTRKAGRESFRRLDHLFQSFLIVFLYVGRPIAEPPKGRRKRCVCWRRTRRICG